jgi:hypothetical protein
MSGDSGILNASFGFWILDFGFWILDFGFNHPYLANKLH